MDYLTHITQHNQRLDQIAWDYYGDISKTALIYDANPLLSIWRNYPAGVVIYIPIIDAPASTADLPPWLR